MGSRTGLLDTRGYANSAGLLRSPFAHAPQASLLASNPGDAVPGQGGRVVGRLAWFLKRHEFTRSERAQFVVVGLLGFDGDTVVPGHYLYTTTDQS